MSEPFKADAVLDFMFSISISRSFSVLLAALDFGGSVPGDHSRPSSSKVADLLAHEMNDRDKRTFSA